MIKPKHKAGSLLLQWAKDHAPHALEDLASELDINSNTIRRWIQGVAEPGISYATDIERLTGTPLAAWGSNHEQD